MATALMAVAMTVGPSILGAPDEVYAGEAVTVDRDGNDYVFYFTKGDPDPESLRKAFRSVGLDVSVTLVPVSPRDPFPYFSLVRNGGIQTSYRSAECAERVGGCLGSMRVSAELTGPAEFRLGRPARPGEPYVASVDATLPGEVLAGVQIDGKTAAEVVRIARERGLRVIYTIDWPLKEGWASRRRDSRGRSLLLASIPPGQWRAWKRTTTARSSCMSYLGPARPRPQNSAVITGTPTLLSPAEQPLRASTAIPLQHGQPRQGQGASVAAARAYAFRAWNQPSVDPQS
ncbi:hypothetical protein ACFQ0B_80725 [Nonomuraea thailandensis]